MDREPVDSGNGPAEVYSRRLRELHKECLDNAPEAQSLLAPRFSVGKRGSTSSFRSPEGTAQGHDLCGNQLPLRDFHQSLPECF